MQIKKGNNKFWMVMLIILFALLKQIIVTKIPIYVRANQIYDDRLMIDMANSLINGKWLGDYSHLILTKGMFFPLFLAISHWLGVSYLAMTTLVYTISCVVFIYSIRSLCKKNWILLTIYIVLLFNPASFSLWTVQMIYRNSVIQSQIIFIIACIIGLYLNRQGSLKKLIIWAGGAGIALASMWNTREDSIWIIPFVMGATIITISLVIIENKKLSMKTSAKRIVIFCVPIISILVSTNLISAINYFYYGTYTTNELGNSAFTKAYKSILTVKPEHTSQNVSLSRETINRICEVSPSLNKVKPYFDEAYDNGYYEVNDVVERGEIGAGLVFWAVRNCVANAGYSQDAKMANQFYMNVYNEIEQAFKEGKLEKRAIMPSVLMAPYKEGDLIKLFPEIQNTISYTLNYKDINVKEVESVDDPSGEGIELFEVITGNKAVYPREYKMNLLGWLLSKDGKEIKVELVDEGKNILDNIYLVDSPDIYQGAKTENAKKCRMNFTKEALKSHTLYLRVLNDKGDILQDIPLDGSVIEINNDLLTGYFDALSIVEVEHPRMGIEKVSVNLLNKVSNIYAKITPIVSLIGLIAYLIITVVFVRAIKNKKYTWNAEWLILTGILASYFALVVGVSYTSISAYNATVPTYLVGAYPLIVIFWIFGLSKLIELLCDFIQSYRSRNI